MNIPLDRFRSIEPQDTKTVLYGLKKAADLAKNGSASQNLPRILIDTDQGIRYDGVLLGLQEHASGFSVLFAHDSMTSGAGKTNLSFLDLRLPFQITVLEAEDFLRILRFGAVPRWSEDENLTTLQLKRSLNDIQKNLLNTGIQLDIDDKLVSEENTQHNVIRDVAQNLMEFIEKNSSDAVGKKAIQNIKTIKIQFSHAAHLTASRDGSQISINLDPLEGLSRKEEFFDRISSCL